MSAETVYVGLGSNLDKPRSQVEQALAELNHISGCRLQARSSLYASKPMGPQDQPDYINAVASLECVLEPAQLLNELQQIEQQHNRVRERRWGPRTLDLDILLFGNRTIDEPDLVIPHPGIGDRSFVLVPLAELTPDLVIPGVGRVSDKVEPEVLETLIKLETTHEQNHHYNP